MNTKLWHAMVLIINLILALMFSCEPESITDGQITGNSKCYDTYVLYYYKIDDNSCEGIRRSVSIRTNEKERLENLLASTTETCIQVQIKYYFLGIKDYVNGYIKNSSSTFKQIIDCN